MRGPESRTAGAQGIYLSGEGKPEYKGHQLSLIMNHQATAKVCQSFTGQQSKATTVLPISWFSQGKPILKSSFVSYIQIPCGLQVACGLHFRSPSKYEASVLCRLNEQSATGSMHEQPLGWSATESS